MFRHLHLLAILLLTAQLAGAQATCSSAPGDQTTFGTNNTWIGYAYNNTNFTNYRGYITSGTSTNPNFDTDFGGANGNFSTSGCNVTKSTFSIRFKLRKTFSSGNYRFIVGGDDGYRLSLDGGATWVINNYNDHAYATTTYDVFLSGTYNMVLEYYENESDNRVSFNVSTLCSPSENTATYGTGDVWNGYVYDGTNFNNYVGMITEGTAGNPDFDQNFGGSNITLNTSACGTSTETFSVRYRLRRNFAAGTYQFTVGGDDGFRLSIDGGATWIIDRWFDQVYTLAVSSPVNMNGDYDMVLEFYENGGENRVSFDMETLILLPVKLSDFNAVVKNSQPVLNWVISSNSTPDYFIVERSIDNRQFHEIGTIEPETAVNKTRFSFTDKSAKGNLFYYRLKIADTDRRVTYSKTLAVHLNHHSEQEVLVYPTMVTGNQVMIKPGVKQDQVQLILSDLSGRVLLKQQMGNLEAGQAKAFNLSPIQGNKGMYILKITSSNGLDQTRKIVL